MSNQTVTSSSLQQMLDATKPGDITEAGKSFTGLYQQLTDTSGMLVKHAQTLADQWSGTSAVKALNQMQMLQQTASDLQQNVYLAQQGMVTYGQVLSEYQQSVPKPVQVTNVPSPTTDPVGFQQALTQQQANNTAADNASQQAFEEMNQHIQNAYSLMPLTINKNLPQTAPKNPPGPALSGGASVPGGSAGSGGAGGTPVAPVSGVGSGPGGGPVISGVVPPVPAQQPAGKTPSPILSGLQPPSGPGGEMYTPPSGGQLPGVPPTGGGGPGLPIVPGLPGGGDDGIPADSGIPGNGAGGVPSGDDGGTPGVDDVPPGPADGVGGESPFGLPGMGGFGGGAGAGRARQAWDSEDQGLWDPQDEGVLGQAPGVSADGMIGADAMPGEGLAVGGLQGAGGGSGFPGGAGASSAAAEEDGGFPMMGGGAGGRRAGSDRQRQAWMQEDADIWGDEADRGVPPVIG